MFVGMLITTAFAENKLFRVSQGTLAETGIERFQDGNINCYVMAGRAISCVKAK